MEEKIEVKEMPRQARLDVAGTLHYVMLRGAVRVRSLGFALGLEAGAGIGGVFGVRLVGSWVFRPPQSRI